MGGDEADILKAPAAARRKLLHRDTGAVRTYRLPRGQNRAGT